jgi:hypothetical protein
MVAEGVFTTANLVSYCSVDDILALLEAYDLSDWGDQEALEVRAAELLAPTKAAVDSSAGRDFLFHAEETVALDGKGSRRLLLAPLGLTPVVQIGSVTVNGTELEGEEWLFYPEEACILLAAASRLGACFPVGNRNVEIALDWGYEVTPPDICAAQAKLAAAELLGMATGERGGVEAVSLGDYSVRYGSAGRFASAVRRLVAEAAEAVDRYRGLDFAVV